MQGWYLPAFSQSLRPIEKRNGVLSDENPLGQEPQAAVDSTMLPQFVSTCFFIFSIFPICFRDFWPNNRMLNVWTVQASTRPHRRNMSQNFWIPVPVERHEIKRFAQEQLDSDMAKGSNGSILVSLLAVCCFMCWIMRTEATLALFEWKHTMDGHGFVQMKILRIEELRRIVHITSQCGHVCDTANPCKHCDTCGTVCESILDGPNR